MTDYKYPYLKMLGVRNLKYPFESYLRDVTNLYKAIVSSGKTYDLIIGVQRGGLIPAVHLSNLLNVPMQTLQWSLKDNMREGANPHLICSKANNKNVLLVDDILDNGHTIHEIHERYWKMDTAVLIYNTSNQFGIVPDYAGWVIDREEIPQWFDYWWEVQ